MAVFFTQFNVCPNSNNTHNIKSEGALAACWILAEDANSAYLKAKFFVERDEWTIVSSEISSTPVAREMFFGKDIGIKNYDLAILNGSSVYYVAWEKGITQETEFQLKVDDKFDKSLYYKNQSSISKKGYCLHPDREACCNKIIKAHSIQKHQSLSSIAINNHVYQMARTANTSSTLGISYQKQGVNKASTFRGFCKKHDNALFEPIDNCVLKPSEEQVFLYAYRSICKELFEKNKALSLFKEAIQSFTKNCAEKQLIESMYEGTKNGLNNLIRIKEIYDLTLRERNFSDIKFIIFKCKGKPNIAFSGLIYPEFDFLGNQIQNLHNMNNSLSLVTVCSAPMSDGWGYLLAWHTVGGSVGDTFVQSLAEVINVGVSVEDTLFRFIISSCENHAFSPDWWENISPLHRNEIIQRVTQMTDAMVDTSNDYLQHGLSDIVGWSFEDVVTNLEPCT
ncbi:hypothetical protein L8R84_22810 [Vibrio splendidus]|uniref:hypothetical protein n=1 Tax=Vibrio splendidus TaxID=29497 RepID=UPI0024689D6C|nr:hypothetical protein [Vibrio splendidus]MDH5938941.1 hypothetical protein [Vibrio splendidus]